jgi:hypothetical protein
MKYVKDLLHSGSKREVEDFLLGESNEEQEELDQIDEDIKSEESEEEVDLSQVNFDRALYHKLPESDREYEEIL